MNRPPLAARMTPKQAAFAREYLVDRNATQAAIRAGYSAKTANVAGSRLLADVKVAAEVAKNEAETAERVSITVDNVLDMLKREANAGKKSVPNQARIRAQELIGKHIGMFKDRMEFSFEKLSPEELLKLEAISRKSQG